MTAYKLTDTIIGELTGAARSLCQRHVYNAENNFPLDLKTVQQALIPAHWRDAVNKMQADGWQWQTYSSTKAVVVHEQIKRAAFLRISTNYNSGLFRPNALVDKTALHTDALDKDDRQKLIMWCNHAVHTRRRATMTFHTVRRFFRDYAPTTAHVTVRWPEIAMLVEHTSHWRNRESWRAKFAEKVTRGRRRYEWSGEDETWAKANIKVMALSEDVLAEALLLPTQVETKGLDVTVAGWGQLDGDIDTGLPQHVL